MFTDSRETLVEVSCQLLCVVLESNIFLNKDQDGANSSGNTSDEKSSPDVSASTRTNLFISYISRIHRDEVFYNIPLFILT